MASLMYVGIFPAILINLAVNKIQSDKYSKKDEK
jgi:hypothetical protein